ncbi:ADP-ribosyltransferase [Aeromonas hydrophila]|uniref:ADP-ribosyltransferase n=1 Tax=Aeromonas hydrophila TaxID=644 RepID=UPI003BA29921
MIIDYRNEILHEHSAINSVRFSYQRFLVSRDQPEDTYIAPLNAIMSCIAGSHKLDYIRLCCDSKSKQSIICSQYALYFDVESKKKERIAIAMYQSANIKDSVDDLKPHKIINMFLNNETLTQNQTVKAQEWVNGLRNSFTISSECGMLQVGQRLFRGITLNEVDFQHYVHAQRDSTSIKQNGFSSTSLSESVATSFATLSHANRLQDLDKERENPHVPVVLELTNRTSGLPFLMPDAFRKPEKSQGQMEILLPEGLSWKPTYIDLSVQPAKIYADIVKVDQVKQSKRVEVE